MITATGLANPTHTRIIWSHNPLDLLFGAPSHHSMSCLESFKKQPEERLFIGGEGVHYCNNTMYIWNYNGYWWELLAFVSCGQFSANRQETREMQSSTQTVYSWFWR